jgi:hypothetical protein
MNTPAISAEYLTQTGAAVAIDPERPPSPDTLVRWHDRVKGPRDGYGRRIWTSQIVEAIRQARAQAQHVPKPL